MGKLFDLVKNEVQLTPNVLAVPAFYKLWANDKDKNKVNATKELKYVVFLCDFKSPYKDMSYLEKEPLIRHDVFGDKDNWEPNEQVKDAIETYNKLQKTRTMYLLDSARKAVEKLAEYFDTVDFKETDTFGKPIHSAATVSKNLKEVGSIVKSLIILEKQVQSEISELSVRGDSDIGYYENPESVNSVFNE